MSRPVLLSVSLLLALTLSAAALAQIRRPPGGGQNQKGQPFDGEGTIDAVGMGRIQMTTTTNQKMLVFVPPNASVRLTGTATADFLHPGLCVEFTAEVNKNGVAKDTISQLTIFTPTQETQVGLYPEGAAIKGKKGDGEGPAAKFGGDPGIGFGEPPAKGTKGKAGRKGKQLGGGDAADPFGSLDAPAGKKGGARKGGAGSGVQLPGVCTVRGKITVCHGTNLKVNYGKGVVTAELDDNPQISVDMADCSMAVKGDKISVKGQSLNKMVQAETVKIESAQPLSGGGKKGRGKAGATKGERPAKAEKPSGKHATPKKGGNDVEPAEPKEKEEALPEKEKGKAE
jgi:hypothetical protein